MCVRACVCVYIYSLERETKCLNFKAEEPAKCTYNVILWRIRLMFVPLRLTWRRFTARERHKWRLNVAGDKETYLGLHIKPPLPPLYFYQILTTFGVSARIIKFHGCPSGGNLAEMCGQTDITKVMETVGDCAAASKNRTTDYIGPCYGLNC